MQSYRKILVPVDGSELSTLALDKAVSLARLIDASLTVVHVMEPVALSYTGYEGAEINSAIALIENENVSGIRKYLVEFENKAKAKGVDADHRILKGNIQGEIVDLSNDFDLIVMGTQGRNALTSLLLGSTAEYVARHACCPVMLVREFRKDCRRKG